LYKFNCFSFKYSNLGENKVGKEGGFELVKMLLGKTKIVQLFLGKIMWGIAN